MEKRVQALVILTTICLTYFVENFFRSAASALTPVLIQELGISRGAMGLLITGFFLIYGVMQFPAGLLSERFGPRRCIVWFTALTVIGSLMFWMSHRYELLLVAQFIMGVGTSVFYLNAITLISRWFPVERKATAVGVLSASSGIGGFASYMGFPLAAVFIGGWRILYFLMFIVLAFNWMMNYFLLIDSPSPLGNLIPQKSHGLISLLKEAASESSLHPLFFGYAMLGLNFTLFSWANQFLVESKGLIYLEAGFVTSIGTVAGFLGCIVIGVISDRLRKRRLPILLFLGTYSALLLLFILFPDGKPMITYALIWGTMSVCSSVWVLFPSMVGEVVPSRLAGVGFGVMNGTTMIISSLVTPIYGSLVDITGNFYIPTLLSLILSGITLIGLFFLLNETYGKIVN